MYTTGSWRLSAATRYCCRSAGRPIGGSAAAGTPGGVVDAAAAAGPAAVTAGSAGAAVAACAAPEVDALLPADASDPASLSDPGEGGAAASGVAGVPGMMWHAEDAELPPLLLLLRTGWRMGGSACCAGTSSRAGPSTADDASVAAGTAGTGRGTGGCGSSCRRSSRGPTTCTCWGQSSGLGSSAGDQM